jgi:DNA-binding transcriptional MerR regulator
MKKESENTFSISQVSEMTGVSKNRIREWHDKAYLPVVQWISVGSRRHRRFSEKDIKLIMRISEYLKQVTCPQKWYQPLN